MDNKDEMILDLIKGNARMSYKDIGDAIGISRVAAMKRIRKLEDSGIIRGYNTYIDRPEENTIIIDIVTKPGRLDDTVEYLATRTAFVRQIYKTTKENHIHLVAVSDDLSNLQYLLRMIRTACKDDIENITCHGVKEVIKDVYGGIRYVKRDQTDSAGDNGTT
ncbi:MAG: Lrp/AsnC family transcriptional regulator [Lachnospiraceae bacterium]|nr:Lrp/AsnC family transcriptional regulator [Lachnospiraceae bacterium]